MVRRPPRQMPPAGATVTFDSVPEVLSVADLFALAMAMEREAGERYAALVTQMTEDGEPELAALFARLRDAETDHENGIGVWAKREGVTPSDTLSFQWDNPEAPSETDVAEAGGTMMSPWKALALAVRNEERAFAFYTQIAARTPRMEVREYAERMAREELEHVALLRLERRRAWSGEYSATLAALPTVGPPPNDDSDAFMAWLKTVELETAGRMLSKARLCREAKAGDVADLFQTLAEDTEAHARAAGAERPVPEVHAAPGAPSDLLREEGQRHARLYDVLMRAVETTHEEDLVQPAHDLIATVLGRLARLRDERARLKAEGR